MPPPRRQYLGTLSNRNRTSRFRIAIGHDPASNKLLIAFHLSFKLRSSTSAKPKHIFFIIPTDQLDVDRTRGAWNSAVIDTNGVSEATLEQLRRAGIVESMSGDPPRILRIQLRLKFPGYAIMPRATVGKAIEGTPLELLQNLQSLCEANCIDAYMRFNVQTQIGLERMQQIRQQDVPSMPIINVESMYNGLGAINVWHQYGISDNSETRTHQPPAMEDEHTSLAPPPPPYPGAPLDAGLLTSPQPPTPVPTSHATEVMSTPELGPLDPVVLVPCSEADSSGSRPSSGGSATYFRHFGHVDAGVALKEAQSEQRLIA